VTLGGCGRIGFGPLGGAGAGDGGGSGSGDGGFAGHSVTYIKASNTDAGDRFGGAIALSTDGSTLAVGAPYEKSAATGIDGNQADNSAYDSGAAYVFVRAGASWSQQAYIKASNTDAQDMFGRAIAVSADGNTLAVSAPQESSAATGIGGNQADNSAATSGAVYVLVRAGTTWSQQAYVKASNTASGDTFGGSVALSADGNTLAVGAYGASSFTGAVYVFTRAGATWSQQAIVKASNAEASDTFGDPVTLSADGNTLAVSASWESSAATGIGGNQADNSAAKAGAVYVFTRAGTAWSQQAYIKASNTDAGDQFGWTVALSGDGTTLEAGAVNEASAATGIDGNQSDNTAASAGAVYVFSRAGAIWSQQAYVKASNTDPNDRFGSSVAVSSDGSALAIGAPLEASAATGIGGDQADNSASAAGAAYGYARAGATWSTQGYLKASNTDGGDQFGLALTMSGDASTLAVGGPQESSAATGVGGDQADNTAFAAGAVYVIE
jgi:hypothetical protein